MVLRPSLLSLLSLAALLSGGTALAASPIFMAPSASAPATAGLPVCGAGTTGTSAPQVGGVQTASIACVPPPATTAPVAGLPAPTAGTSYATTQQMQGGVQWGEALGSTLGGANPLQSAGGTSTSFNASPLGGSPADGGGTANVGYQAQSNYSLALQCNTANPSLPSTKSYSAGGVTLSVGSCTVSGTGSAAQVTSLNLAACSKTQTGGTCTSADFNYVTLYPGQMQDLTGVQAAALLVSCPADGSLKCTANVQVLASLQVSGDNLQTAGAAAAAANPEAQMLSGVASNGTYQGTVQTWARANGAYYANTEAQLNTGSSNITVTTWNGKSSATLESNNCPPPTQQCVQYATTTNNWTTSCTSDVPTTVQTCNTTTPTVSCAVSDSTQAFNCNKTLTAQVSETPATCNFGPTVYGGFNGGKPTTWFTVSCSGGAIQVTAGAYGCPILDAAYCGWVDFAENTWGNNNYVTGGTINNPGAFSLTAGQPASGSGSGYYSFTGNVPFTYTFDGSTLTLSGTGPNIVVKYSGCSPASCSAHYGSNLLDTRISAICSRGSRTTTYTTLCTYRNVVSTSAALPVTPASISVSTTWADGCSTYEAAQ